MTTPSVIETAPTHESRQTVTYANLRPGDRFNPNGRLCARTVAHVSKPYSLGRVTAVNIMCTDGYSVAVCADFPAKPQPIR